MYLICQMQTTDATTKQRTQWQDSKAQHALTTAFDKKYLKTQTSQAFSEQYLVQTAMQDSATQNSC